MTKGIVVWICGVFLLMTSCAESNNACQICGEFELVNLSKNEVNHEKKHDLSIRRNLTMDAVVGLDYYTIWSWNEDLPDSAWMENMEKDIQIEKSKFTLKQNGTWSWKIITKEVFKSPECFGVNEFTVDKDYHETGRWTYVRGKTDIISLARTETWIRNSIEATSKVNWLETADYYPYIKHIKHKPGETGRYFEVFRDNLSDQLILTSLTDDHRTFNYGIHESAYSLTEGNVFMKLGQKEPEVRIENLVHNLE